jgi:O-antigen ligase
LAHFPLIDPGESFRNGLVRVRVGYYHASDLGRVLAVALPFLLVAATRKRPSTWLRVGTALVVIAVILTWTFTVWLAIGVSLVVFAAASTARGRGAVAGFTLLAVVLVIAVGGPVNQLVESRVHPTGSSLSEAQYRLALVPASIQYADSHSLLGSGPGTFNLDRIGYPIDGVETLLVDDNTFTTELVEVGYPGAVLFALALAAFSVAWWKRRRSPLYAAALASLVAFVLCSATIDSLARDAPLLAVAVLFGVATGAAESDPDLTQISAAGSVRSSGELGTRSLVKLG